MQAHVNSITLEYNTFGRPDDEPLLLISGLNTPMTRWTDDFCTGLAERGLYVIRFDNRDCGLSTHCDHAPTMGTLTLLARRLLGLPIRPAYGLMDMVSDTLSLLDALHIPRAHIVGRSMGGAIAQRLTAAYPERVSSLTLLMSSTGQRWLPLPKLNVLWMMLRQRPDPRIDLNGYLNSRVRYTQAIGSRQFPLTAEAIRTRVMADLQRAGSHPDAGKRQLAALLSAGDLRPWIRKITAPTLVIHGATDPLLPLACGIDIQRNIPAARLEVIPAMGHALHPAFYAQLIASITMHALGAAKPHA